jgi:hypothetical protein
MVFGGGLCFGVWDHGIAWRYLLYLIMYHIDDDDDNENESVYTYREVQDLVWFERVKYQRPDMSLLTKVAYDTHWNCKQKVLWLFVRIRIHFISYVVIFHGIARLRSQ